MMFSALGDELRAADPNLAAVHACARAVADERLELLGGDRFDAPAARVVDDCLGQRVLGPGLDGAGELEGLLLVVAVACPSSASRSCRKRRPAPAQALLAAARP